MTPEGKVKQQVKQIIIDAGGWHFLPVSRGMGQHGIPDVISCVPVKITQDMVGETLGIFVAVETKAGGKTEATALQMYQMKKIREAFGTVLLVNAEKVERFREFIRRLVQGKHK